MKDVSQNWKMKAKPLAEIIDVQKLKDYNFYQINCHNPTFHGINEEFSFLILGQSFLYTKTLPTITQTQSALCKIFFPVKSIFCMHINHTRNFFYQNKGFIPLNKILTLWINKIKYLGNLFIVMVLLVFEDFDL